MVRHRESCEYVYDQILKQTRSYSHCRTHVYKLCGAARWANAAAESDRLWLLEGSIEECLDTYGQFDV